MNRRIIAAMVIAIIAIIPTVATAAVIVKQETTVNVTPTSDLVCFAPGSDYKIANELGFMQISNGSYTNNISITLNGIYGRGFVIIGDALDIVNNTSSGFTLYVWLNGSLPAGIIMFYYSTYNTTWSQEYSFPVYNDSGNCPANGGGFFSFHFVRFGEGIHIKSGGVAEHIGFIIPGLYSGTGYITLSAKLIE